MSGDPFDWRPSAGVRTMQQRRVNNMPMARQRLRYGESWTRATVAMVIVLFLAFLMVEFSG